MPVPELSPHHAAALDEAVGRFRDDSTVLAVLFGNSAEALADEMLGYRDWSLEPHHAAAQFLRNTEWPWRFGPPALEDR